MSPPLWLPETIAAAAAAASSCTRYRLSVSRFDKLLTLVEMIVITLSPSDNLK